MSTLTRSRLHDLVDVLPDDELPHAERFLEYLRDRGSEISYTTAAAPFDDEPETDDERAAVEEARADVAAGRVSPAADVFRRLGL